MPIKIFPSGRVSRISRIATFDGDLACAAAGRSVTLTFADQVDASRGDMVVGIDGAPPSPTALPRALFWMNSEPLLPGRNYLFKLATTTATATNRAGREHLRSRYAASGRHGRDCAERNRVLHVETRRPIAVERYADCKDTGSFILIDPEIL